MVNEGAQPPGVRTLMIIVFNVQNAYASMSSLTPKESQQL